jgi:site-specific recombinase XerD
MATGHVARQVFDLPEPHASLPTHLSSEQLARLLQRPAAPGPAAYRDRAILSLLAGLGLRAGEVATLELDDLDWRAGQLRLRAGKCRRERVLPLPREVGAALAEYLRHGRPHHRDRLVAPDFDQEGEVKRAEQALGASAGSGGSSLLAAARGVHAWLDQGE